MKGNDIMKTINTKSRFGRKLLSVFLAVLMSLSVFSAAFSAQAATWRTGCVPSGNRNSGYTTVYLSNKKKDAKIKIHSYTYLLPANKDKAKEKSTSFHVTMRTTGGKWIWEGDIKTGSGGKIMKLGRDHSAYKICLRQNDIPFGSYTLNYAKYWGIQCTSNCYL